MAGCGHDYCGDLARMVSEACHLPVTDDELLVLVKLCGATRPKGGQRCLIGGQLPGPRRWCNAQQR